MGGSIDVVTSALDLLSGVSNTEVRSTPSQESKQLRAERMAQEAELQRKEGKERRRRRENVTDARERQRQREEAKDNGEYKGNTTLLNGGAGLTDDPDVKTVKLKEKFGE